MNPPDFLPRPRSWDPLPGTVDLRQWLKPGVLRQMARRGRFRSPEAYRIHLSEDRIAIDIGGAAALPHVQAHLEQWATPDPGHVMCGRLEDAPAFARRGFMLDVSRCKVPTRESLALWVKRLAAFRFNELQLYTEHTFAYAAHPDVWRDASPITPEDIAWLKPICREHGIELIPNQNCFGHFERWLRHPAYRTYAECPDGFTTPWGEHRSVGSVLKPDKASLDLVTGLLDELLPHFDGKRVNIGCDETFELGQGASLTRCEREGPGRIYTGFVKEVMRHVQKKHGRRPEFWGDILLKHPERLADLPQEAIALEWGYEADHPFSRDCRTFAASGLDFVVCPGSSSWRSFAGRTETMWTNIGRAAEHALANGASGMLLTDWGDCGHPQLEEVTLPALAWFGANAWNPDTPTREEVLRWCDQAGFDGQNGDTARWLAAGRISDLTGWHPVNSNAIFQMFTDNPLTRERRAEVGTDRLYLALEAIDELQAPRAAPDAWDQTLRNLRLGLIRERVRRGEPAGDPGLEEQAREGHETLWRQRNREGGLAESLDLYTREAT